MSWSKKGKNNSIYDIKPKWKVMTLIVVCAFMTFLMLQIIYQKYYYTIQLEGTVNTIDNNKVITFYPFEIDSPDQLGLPVDSNFNDGDIVECKIRVSNFELIGIRYYELIKVKESEEAKRIVNIPRQYSKFMDDIVAAGYYDIEEITVAEQSIKSYIVPKKYLPSIDAMFLDVLADNASD